MSRVQSAVFVLIIALLNSVQSNGVCNLEDVKCTTMGSRDIFTFLMSGIEGVFEPCTTLHLEEVKAEIPSLKYQLSDVNLAGVKDCEVLLLKLNENNFTFKFEMICPHLDLTYHHNYKGLWNIVEIDGSGFTNITLNDYKVKVKGDYGEFVTENDHKPRFFIKRYNTEFEPKGTIKIEINGPLHGDEAKSDLAENYIKQNARQMEKLLRSPTMERLIAIFMEATDIYIRTFPKDVVLPVRYSTIK